MRVSDDELGRYYESLSDEALREIDPADLTEGARKCYERELAKRGPVRRAAPRPVEIEEEEEVDAEESIDAEEGIDGEPDWLEHAACVCSFQVPPGSTNAVDAAAARHALLEAGVPCHLSVIPPDASQADGPQHEECRVLVPEALNLKAISVLDREIFNEEMEATWRTHFAALSDEELDALDPDDLCAGLLDRVERLTRAYEDEVARRRS